MSTCPKLLTQTRRGRWKIHHLGVSRTHTESDSAAAGEFPPQQKPSSSRTVGVPPLSLTVLLPASPRAVHPVTSWSSSSSADQSQQGGEELVSAAVMTPSAVARRQVGTDTDDVSTFATPDDTLPTNVDKLATELVELRAEFRVQTEGIREDLRADFRAQISKFEVMFQAFMERSDTTTKTVSEVEGRVGNIEKDADVTYRHVDSINDKLVQFDKRVRELRHDRGIRERTETDL